MREKPLARSLLWSTPTRRLVWHDERATYGVPQTHVVLILEHSARDALGGQGWKEVERVRVDLRLETVLGALWEAYLHEHRVAELARDEEDQA